MKYFVESLVADLPRPGQLNEREGQPLTQNWDVASPEDGQRIGLHFLNIPPDQDRIVIRTRTVWTGNQDHHRFGVVRHLCKNYIRNLESEPPVTSAPLLLARMPLIT